MLRAVTAAFSLVLLLGVYYAAGVQLPVYDLQRAVVAEFLKAVFSHLTPLSSMLGGGVEISSSGFVLSSSYGLLPLASLVAAGLLVGLMSRSMPQAVMAALTTSILLIVSAITLLIGFLPTLPAQAENVRWQVDSVFTALFIERPLELPAIVAVPVISSIPTGLVMERLWVQQSREERQLFSWRRRAYLKNVA
ncbi:MAG: hypothetical protein RMJ28_06325 [Nitrososphaerota archaeon]|nr:hypothetical protein [Candidatus Calditenuaceae archaeon]MDW8073830.1 hypothetical protein [Nitrososphaerota archaeon]